MLDLKLIRSDPERVKTALARRGAAAQVDELLALDARRRELLPEIESAQAERKTLSQQIGEVKQGGGEAGELMASVQELKERIESGKEELEKVEAELGRIVVALPNLPDPDAPDGMTEEDAVVLREVGTRTEFDFEPRDHLEIGTELGLIDMEAAARLSGSRFAYLKGDLVLLELALVRFAIELARGEGHEPVVPPVLVREEALDGTGFLPGDRDQIYEIPKDELFLTGTSEVALAGLHADQILDAADLPLRYAASRPVSAARPAPPAATPAASSASTSSTRSRCSRSSSPRSRPPSTSACWRSRSGSSPSWRSPTGWSTSPSATSARRPRRSTTARPGSRARSATAS